MATFSATREQNKMGVTFSKYLLLRDLFEKVAINKVKGLGFFVEDFDLKNTKKKWAKYCAAYGVERFESSLGECEQVKDKVLLQFGSDCYLVPKDLCEKALVLGEFPSE